jgi:hypothetical protein
MRDALFFLTLGMLFTHELDAMPNHEWRGLPGLGALPDDVAMVAFVVLHVPLFAAVVAFVASPIERTRTIARFVVAGFVVVHAGLHALSMGDPGYEFSSLLSTSLIFGGGVLGALYLALEIRSRRGSRPAAT